MMEWQRDQAVLVEKARELNAEDLAGKFTIGVLVDKELPNFVDEYEKVKQHAKTNVFAI
jgi:2-oxoglutarate ferredoxin oxidoreductase subunit beta